MADVYDEVSRLGDNGFAEIILTGVQLGAYGIDLPEGHTLVKLIECLSTIPAIRRIRLSSIGPNDVTNDIIACMQSNQKLCNHLHLPLQSGDSGILQRMGRTYTRDDYVRVLELLLEKVPGFLYSTDIIVGFPGETDAAFQNTVQLVEKNPPMKIHVFPYSDRPGTLAMQFDGKLTREIKRRRVNELLRISDHCFERVTSPLIGSVQNILIEKEKKDVHHGNFCLFGKLTNYVPVICYVNYSASRGEMSVSITHREGPQLVGIGQALPV